MRSTSSSSKSSFTRPETLHCGSAPRLDHTGHRFRDGWRAKETADPTRSHALAVYTSNSVPIPVLARAPLRQRGPRQGVADEVFHGRDAGHVCVQLVPGLDLPTLGMLSWLCWFNPDNIVLSQLAGSDGLGLGTVSLDWAALSSYVQPLVTPWFTQVSILVGFVLVVYIMVPWAYYVDLWHSKNYPILSAALFRENGSVHDKDKVMTNDLFDQAKYDAYGPLRMDSFFAFT